MHPWNGLARTAGELTEWAFSASLQLVESATLLTHVASLGLEFRRRGMAAHAGKLRAYYAVLRAGAVDARHSVDLHWSEALTVEWMKVLQVPPYQASYRAQSRRAACPKCGSREREVQTAMNFPGGFLAACKCGERWLILDK